MWLWMSLCLDFKSTVWSCSAKWRAAEKTSRSRATASPWHGLHLLPLGRLDNNDHGNHYGEQECW